MFEIDKQQMALRIRQIRSNAALRQWELAQRLGTTQSAVHKYERGVVPEPRRLIELARIGETSVEWILTGAHWENGSAEQARVDSRALRTAAMLGDAPDRWLAAIDEALRIGQETSRVLAEQGWRERGRAADWQADLEATERLLEVARRIQRAVLRQVADEASRRLEHLAEGAGSLALAGD